MPPEFGQFTGNQENCRAGGRQFIEQAVDLRLGADIHAARGLIDDQDRAFAGQPLGEGDFLLVAPLRLRTGASRVGVLTRSRSAKRRAMPARPRG